MNESFLPIGSVVLLKEATKRVMITGYSMETSDNGEKQYYDYCGCMFPEGIIDTERIALFNQDQIERVFFLGLQDQESMSFRDGLKDFINNKRASNQQNS